MSIQYNRGILIGALLLCGYLMIALAWADDSSCGAGQAAGGASTDWEFSPGETCSQASASQKCTCPISPQGGETLYSGCPTSQTCMNSQCTQKFCVAINWNREGFPYRSANCGCPQPVTSPTPVIHCKCPLKPENIKSDCDDNRYGCMYDECTGWGEDVEHTDENLEVFVCNKP